MLASTHERTHERTLEIVPLEALREQAEAFGD
jgi:hypothetical protein